MTNYSAGQHSVIIVDSDATELANLTSGFSLEGYDVAQCQSSEIAKRILSNRQFDVALIDLMMPETNGLQLSRHIHAMYPHALIILMSSYHLSPVQLSKANAGISGFIPRPFKLSEVLSFIRYKLNPEKSDENKQVPSSRQKVIKTARRLPIFVSKVS